MNAGAGNLLPGNRVPAPCVLFGEDGCAAFAIGTQLVLT